MIFRDRPPYVYFVRAVTGEGAVKIGCSQVPENRLSTLMTWAPVPLAIVATIAGDEKLERRFHARFEPQHSHREWFHPSPELSAVIQQVAAGEFDVNTLPTGKLARVTRKNFKWSDNQRRGLSFTHRINHLENRGVTVPAEVKTAARRWRSGPYSDDYDPHNPADAALIEAFFAQHPPKSRAA